MSDWCEPWASLERTVDASAEIVTLEEAKDHLRVDSTAEDELIEALIRAARMAIEERTSRATVTQTWVMTLDAFPDEAEIRLPRPPLASVSSVQYVDANGDTQTFSPSNYSVVTRSLPGAIRLVYNATWPTTRAQPNAVTITYVAGTAASAVPAPMVHAAKLIVGDLFRSRESVMLEQPSTNPTVEMLLAPYVARYF